MFSIFVPILWVVTQINSIQSPSILAQNLPLTIGNISIFLILFSLFLQTKDFVFNQTQINSVGAAPSNLWAPALFLQFFVFQFLSLAKKFETIKLENLKLNTLPLTVFHLSNPSNLALSIEKIIASEKVQDQVRLLENLHLLNADIFKQLAAIQAQLDQELNLVEEFHQHKLNIHSVLTSLVTAAQFAVGFVPVLVQLNAAPTFDLNLEPAEDLEENIKKRISITVHPLFFQEVVFSLPNGEVSNQLNYFGLFIIRYFFTFLRFQKKQFSYTHWETESSFPQHEVHELKEFLKITSTLSGIPLKEEVLDQKIVFVVDLNEVDPEMKPYVQQLIKALLEVGYHQSGLFRKKTVRFALITHNPKELKVEEEFKSFVSTYQNEHQLLMNWNDPKEVDLYHTPMFVFYYKTPWKKNSGLLGLLSMYDLFAKNQMSISGVMRKTIASYIHFSIAVDSDISAKLTAVRRLASFISIQS